MRLVFVTPSLEENSLGRAYCLWQLATHLGWRSEVISVDGARLWAPLRASRFANACRLISRDQLNEIRRVLDEVDLVVAVKPLPNSFGLVLRAHPASPVLLDIDDPDIDVILARRSLIKKVAKHVRRPRLMHWMHDLERTVSSTPRTVSNPVLQKRHGGIVIPHVRQIGPRTGPPSSSKTVVAFVGTRHRHKGVGVLRAAVAALDTNAFELVITDSPPVDARPWERWVGTTTLDEGRRLLEAAHVIAIPSLVAPWSVGQLPVKLIDAMAAGRVVVASEVGPIPWALGDAGVLVPPGDSRSLGRAIVEAATPICQEDLGQRAWRRAVAKFSVQAVADAFAAACHSAVGTA